ncbi:MAG TPA: autotransporter domain-containing protein [Candidatus Omnitrophota bacterium]|nr:autotransporter domain-containing protein [Candidatus Omnitrophota bacterium]HPS36301.1 autotransporter domain-containing protein [Candidatus Omnitrophota bacterium]
MKKNLLIALVSFCFLFPAVSALAGDGSVWTGGGGDGVWGSTGNWLNNTIPGTGEKATFSSDGSGHTLISLDNRFDPPGTPGAKTIRDIQFDNSAADLASYTIGRAGTDTLTIDDGGSIVMNDNVVTTQTIAADVTLAGSATFTNNSANDAFVMNVTGSVTGSGMGQLTLNGSDTGSNTISGDISGASLHVRKNGIGTWVLSGTNTYGGTTTVEEGTLTLSDGAAIKDTSAVVVTGGTLDVATDETVGAVTISGGTVSGAGKLTGSSYSLTNTGTVSAVLAGASSAVTKEGAGTTVLSGNNTYGGGTTIKAGTLSGTTNAAAFGTGTITVGDSAGANNATLNGGLAGTFANAISIAGGNTGTATITSSAASIFSGAVGLNTHALTLSTAGSTLELTGGITGAGNLTLDATAGNAITLSGTSVNNTGTITNSGAGNATNIISGGVGANVTGITQNSTTSGLTVQTTALTVNTAGTTLTNAAGGAALTVSSAVAGTGNLTLKNNSNLASGVTLGAVNNTGTVTNSGTSTGTSAVTGVIGTNVTGVVQNSATSALVLSGTNLYTGTTTVTAGILRAGAAAGGKAFGSGSAVTLANVGSAALDLDDFNQTVGSLSGGGTTGGNVTLGSGTLTVGDATSTTYSGVISGTGGITKVGTGTLTFGNANTYDGTTLVSAGTLSYNNSLSTGGAVTNNAGLTLGSNTLTLLTGAYTQGAGASLNLNIDSASVFGNIVATAGNATMTAASTINVTVGSEYIAGGTTFKIVDGAAGGTITPANLTINSSSSIVTFTGSASGGDLILTAVRSGAYNQNTTANSNGQAAGAALEQAGQNGATGDMLNVLNTLDTLPPDQIGNALDTMNPDPSGGAEQGSLAATDLFMGSVSNRLGNARNSMGGVSTGDMIEGMGVWIQGLGSHVKQDARKGIEGYKANLFGTTLGTDKMLDNHVRLGLAGGYGLAKVNSKTPGSPSNTIDSWQAAIYGSYDSTDLCKARHSNKNSREAVRNQVEDNWYVDGTIAFTENNYDSRREIWLTPTTRRLAKADHHGQQYTTKLESGYTFVFKETKNLEVTPFASLQYSYLRMNEYKEKGADALNLNVNGEGYNELLQALGTRFAYPIVSKKMGTFIPALKAAWMYDYIGDQFESTASFQGGGPAFNTQGAKPAKSGLLLGSELAFLNKGNMTLTANYDLELKDEYASNTYYATARFDF